MLGAALARETLAEVAKRFAEQTVRRLPRQALTKTWYYPIVKQVAKWIGVSVTKRGFAGGVAKPESTEGGCRVNVLRRPMGAPLNLG